MTDIKPQQSPAMRRYNDMIAAKQKATANIVNRPKKSLGWPKLKRRFQSVPMAGRILLLAALLAMVGWGVSRYVHAQNEIKRLSNPQEVARDEQSRLIAKVAEIVELPQGETPTVANISDASKLKNQSFFSRAENGDKVLIYSQAKQAVLYRPSTAKVVQIAPVDLGNAVPQ